MMQARKTLAVFCAAWLMLWSAVVWPDEESQESASEDQPAPGEEEDWKARIWAEEDVAAPDAVTVVVTGERSAESEDDSATSLTVVDSASMERLSAVDVSNAVEEVPGVDVQRMSPGGYGTNVSIRGSSDFKPGGFGNRVLVLLDGRPLNAPDTHGVDWSALPTFDLGRVEVLRGPSSALYGSVAVGGVVQLFSRPAKKQVDLLLGQGFADSLANRFQLAGSLSDVHPEGGWRMSGWLQRYGGLVAAGSDSARHNSDSRQDGLRATGHWDLTDRQRLSAELSWQTSAGGNPGFEGTSLASRSRRFERDTLGGRVSHGYDTHAGFVLNTDAFYTGFESKVADPDGSRPNAYATQRIGVRSQASFLLGERFFNTGGLEAEAQQVDGDVYSLGDGDYGMLAGALFFQSRVDLGADVELTGGLRVDGIRFATNQAFLSASPKVRLAYRPEPHTVIWASVNRGFRAPSVGELYLRYESSFGLTFQGNPDLKPEVLWAHEIGARHSFFDRRLRLEAVIFWNEGSDTIEFDYRAFPVSAKNLKGSRLVGAEISVRADPLRWLRLTGSWSYLEAIDLENDGWMLYRPRWKGSLWLIFHNERWQVGGRLRAVGERAYDDFLEAELTAIPRRELDPYWLVDLDCSFRITPDWELTGHLNNLLDTEHLIIQDYPAPGRELFLQARLRFN